MTGGQAYDDAVRRARKNSDLGIGLHIAVTRAEVTCRDHCLTRIADHGQLMHNLTWAGIVFFFSPRARRELRWEIEAQFDRFAQSGLICDHVSVHNHMHLHPVVLSIVLAQARRANVTHTQVTHIRLPREPIIWRGWRGRILLRILRNALLWPWAAWVAWRIRAWGFSCNRYLFGITDTAMMGVDTVHSYLKHLPEGLQEMHFHPADDPKNTAAYAEWKTLTSPRVINAVKNLGIKRRRFRQDDSSTKDVPTKNGGTKDVSIKEDIKDVPTKTEDIQDDGTKDRGTKDVNLRDAP